jgi:hypothetical protein
MGIGVGNAIAVAAIEDELGIWEGPNACAYISFFKFCRKRNRHT